MAMLAKKMSGAVSRRMFLAGSAGASLIMGLGTVLPGCSREEAVSDIGTAAASRSFAPTVWFEMDAEGGVLVNIAKAEMGQHVGTALARIIADELGASWSDIRIEHVDSDPKWGYMVTGGSWSVFTSFAMLSRAGAAGRTVLRDAGAALLGVDPASCSVERSHVSANGQEISFAEIVQKGDISRTFSAEELEAMPIKAAAERRYIGRDVRAHDIPAKTTGRAVYGIDVELPGMVYAHPLLPPTRYGSSITEIDDRAARDIPGYKETMVLTDPSDTLQGWAVVIADTYVSAMQAAKAVSVSWEPGPTAAI